MKKILRVLASSSLKATLFSAAMIAGIMGIVGTADGIKKPLNDSGVYNTLVDNVLTKLSENQTEKGPSNETSPLDHAEVRKAAETALDPATLQSSTEQIIDGVYRWLNGEVETPDFNVNLAGAKNNFIAAAVDQAEVRVTALPVCSAQEAAAMGGEVDPFTATCKPAGYNTAAIRQELESELSNGDFLKDTVITADTLKGDDVNAENPFQKSGVSSIPDQFQMAKRGSWMLLGLSLLLAAAVFFLSDTYRKGVKSLGKTLVFVGLFALVTSLITGAVLSSMLKPEGLIGKSIENSLQTSVLAVLRALGDSFSKTIIIYSVAYALLGASALLALKFFWKADPVVAAAVKPAIAKVKK